MASLRSRVRRIAFADNSSSTIVDCHGDAFSVLNSQCQHTQHFNRETPHNGSGSSRPKSRIGQARQAPAIRTSRVQRICRDDNIDRVTTALEHDGCVVIENFSDTVTSERGGQEVLVALEDDEKASQCPISDCVSPRPLVLRDFCANDLLQALCDRFLTVRATVWETEKAEKTSLRPHVVSSANLNLPQTSMEGCFHRSDSVHHTKHSAVEIYEAYRDTSLMVLIPRCHLFSSQVSIQAIPGSHLWGDGRISMSKGVVDLELNEGDAVIMLGSLYHRLRASSAEAGHSRTIQAIWMCLHMC